VIPALWRALRGFITHRGFFLAAGLSFYFLICLIPLLFLFISIAGFVLSSQTAGQAVLHQLGQFVPVYRREMQEILGRIVETRRFSGLLGTLILVLFSTQLFAAQRLVLNEVFSVRRGRGYITGLLSDVAMLMLMGSLFIGSIIVTDLFTWLRVLVLAPASMPRLWIRWTTVGIALGFNTLMFFVAYRYFPSRKVAAWAIFWGALLASGLWETAKQIFRWYILTVGVYDQLYGPLGALVALSMFAYYSGIVFILGAEYTGALDARWRARK
jgi:membrane protein